MTAFARQDILDRLRAKVAELERDKASLSDRLVRQEEAAQNLKDDNVQLFEKIQYLQSRGGGGGGGGDGVAPISARGQAFAAARSNAQGKALGRGFAHPSPDVILQLSRASGVEAKYRSAYEKRTNPFRAFTNNQRRARERKLPTHERALLAASRFFLANKASRLVLLAYVLALHVMVLGVFWHFMHYSHHSCEHAHGHVVAHDHPLMPVVRIG